jgi:hypothetical protein
METAMHGSFDKSGKPDGDSQGNWKVGLFALPALVVIALVGLAMMHPAASNWISDAVQAEFVGINPAPDPSPVQFALPAREMRNVKAN